MTLGEIEKILIDTVCEIQAISGRESVPVTATTRPMEDVPGFDSLNCVEATIDALGKLGIDADFNNVFADDNEALSIKQAAVRLMALMKK